MVTSSARPERRVISLTGTIRWLELFRTTVIRPARSHRRSVSRLIPSAVAASLARTSRSPVPSMAAR